MENEIWKDIKGYEGLYQVSNMGQVKSLPRYTTKGKILVSVKDKDGYLRVCLSKDNRHKSYYVHRLVAEAFIPNPDNLPEINHKDCNPGNDKIENLEYCDRSYNVNYSNRNKIVSDRLSKPVIQMTLDGVIIAIWPSIKQAAKNGFDASNICNCCIGKRKTHAGFIWRYQ